MEFLSTLVPSTSDLEQSDFPLGRHNEEWLVNKRYLLSLSCGFAGLQVVWSVILANGTPFLISLGMSKSMTALVWIAAPLAGTFIQPIVGVESDRCRVSWGRRRPFIIVGAIATACSLTALAWVESIVEMSVGHSGTAIRLEEESRHLIVLLLASILVCCLNISIQPIQVGIRALLIENVPKAQQAHATAWSTYLISTGNIIGYVLGSVQFVGDHGLGHTSQFRVLASIASGALLITTFVTCASVNERVAQSTLDSTGITQRIRDMSAFVRELPSGILDVYKIQFFAWMGWFPMLYYKSTYVSEIYTESILRSAPDMGAAQLEQLQVKAAHIGTIANLWFAVVALGSNILFSVMTKRGTLRNVSGDLSLARLWLLAHILFVLVVLLTFFVTNSVHGTILLAFAGIPWALTQWLPYVALGEELSLITQTESWELKEVPRIEAGTVMSLHNAAISLPQILAAGVCSGIFWVTKDFDQSYATAWAIRIAGIGAVIAAYFTTRLYT